MAVSPAVQFPEPAFHPLVPVVQVPFPAVHVCSTENAEPGEKSKAKAKAGAASPAVNRRENVRRDFIGESDFGENLSF